MLSAHDKNILRSLAEKQLEIAKSNKMVELYKDWKLHNAYKGSRPMIRVETDTFAQEIITPLLRCEDELARNVEFALRLKLINHVEFNDDSIVEPFFPIRNWLSFKPFNLDVKREMSGVKGGIGHHFEEHITDLEADFSILKPSTFWHEAAAQNNYVTIAEDAIGNILPVKTVGGCLYSCPTQEIVHIMSMETMLFSMMDYPDLFKKMMEMLTDDYIRFYRFQEENGFILPTTEGEFLGQGTYCFTEELKSDLPHYTSKDVWGFMDSQETVGVSPDMFAEFIFPFYKKLSEQYGLLSYGCCEPVDPHWESIKQLKNLRKVSISPWCNEEIMGERLAKSGIIYHRKPSAAFLGVGDKLDEEALRKYIKKTVVAAKGCKIEFTQRDVYTINNDLQKVKNYVKIIREESENIYN